MSSWFSFIKIDQNFCYQKKSSKIPGKIFRDVDVRPLEQSCLAQHVLSVLEALEGDEHRPAALDMGAWAGWGAGVTCVHPGGLADGHLPAHVHVQAQQVRDLDPGGEGGLGGHLRSSLPSLSSPGTP